MLVTVFAWSRVPSAFLVVINFLAIGLSSWLLARWAEKLPKYRPVIHAAGSFALAFPWLYTSISTVAPWFLPEDREWTLLMIDRVVFGYTWESWWSFEFSSLVGDLLGLVYISFYCFPLFFLGIVFLRKDWIGLEGITDRLVFTLVLVYCGYLLVPSRSPYEFMEYLKPIENSGLQSFFHQLLADQPWTKRDCFPSGHVLISAYAAWLCWLRARDWAWLMFLWAGLTVIATLYLRYHYLIDVVVSLLILPMMVFFSNLLFGRLGPRLRAS